MTDQTPPESPAGAQPEAATETPAKRERRKRTRLQLAAFVGGIVVAALLALTLVLATGGRMYLVSDAGRDLVTGFVAGKKLGRYGRINVEGLKGDLFDDFALDRVTVTDAKGVWLEARNVRVDWTFWPLITRRFHADEITADVIRVIRRPEVEPSTEPPKPMPLGVDIDRFAANVELLEGFSKEYGRWKLDGSANVPRIGLKDVRVNAYSLNRPGDFLRAAVVFGGPLDDLRLNLRANEAQGGPIAGALGYSPDRPFFATATVNDEVVNAVVRTGDFTPLTVRGRLDEEGSRISGYIDFSGSDLLRPFVERVGRIARFGFAAVPDKARKDYRGVAWALTAENLSSSARGMIRTADRTAPDGFSLEVTTPSLHRLIDMNLAGPAAYTGVFTGDARRWKLAGSASFLNADIASYRATRLSGPVTVVVNDGDMQVETDLRATGGSTEGVIGGLFGATPRLQLKASRSPQGVILFNTLDLQGQALTVKGTGSRALTGGLAFRGQATVSEASRIFTGGRGSFSGPIQARWARSGAPWIITYDARGRGLFIGQTEADRLLGRTPRLQLTGAFKGDQFAVNDARLTAASGRAAAKGIVGTDGSLRLALDWSAQGPFAVGPIEADGAMKGDGALTGTLSRPRVDLRAGFDTLSAGALKLTQAEMILSYRKGADASDGRIAVTGGSNYGPARGSANFFLGGPRIRLTDVDLDAGGVTARGAIALSNRFPSSADLTFSARPGAFLASGTAEGRIRLTEGAGDDTAILDVEGRNVRLAGSTWTLRNLDLSGRGTLDRLPFTLSADVAGATPVQFNGTGVYARENKAQTVTLRGGGRVREVAFTTRTPAVIALSGDGRVVRADLGVGGGVLLAELRQDRQAVVIGAQLTGVDLGSIAPDLRGRATGQVTLRGSGDDLSGTADLTLRQVRSVDAPRGLAVDGTLNATLEGDVLRLQARAQDSQAVQASADLTLPVEASAAPLRLAVVRTRPMSGDVAIQGQIQPIWDLFMGGERSLAGQMSARAAIAGTLAEPRLNGRLDLNQGAFRDSATGLQLRDVTLASRFDDTIAVIERFDAADGAGGKVSGEGRLGLREGSASSLQLALERFRIIDNDVADARASGPLTVTRGADGNIQLAGQINVDEAHIQANPPGSNGIVRMDVVEINRPGGAPEEEIRVSRGPQIGLDVTLRSPGGDVFVEGRGLNVEMNVNARVRGAVTRPILTGTATVVRGDYEFAGKRFVFDDDGSVSLSTDPAQIRLNLAATREDPALTAAIRVTGTAAEPKIALTSTPALPQDEILSQVLFGRSASQLSPFEAAQLASGVASLAGGGGFDVIGNLRQLAGLDRLSFGGEASSLTVAGGRYITDDVYLEIIGGGETGGAVRVEWQVRRNLAVSSRFGGDGDTNLSVRWRRESGRPGGERRRNRAD